MDPSTLVAALVAGATVALKDTAAQAVKDAYAGLKSVLVGRFSVVSVATLEKDPSDDTFQMSVEKEIGLTPEILSDQQVKELVVSLYSSLEKNASKNDLRKIGVDIETIKSNKDTLIRSVSGFDIGVKSTLIDSGANTIIEGISGKPKA